jgi:DNA-binding NtrC family response regulator
LGFLRASLRAAVTNCQPMPQARPKSESFSNQRILLVEDDPELRRSLGHILSQLAFDVEAVADGESALAQLKQSVFDALITDLQLPGVPGEEVITEAKSIYPDLIVMVITGHADISSAVRLMKLGASDYIQKPFLKDELILRLRKAIDDRRLRWDTRALEDKVAAGSLNQIIGDGPAFSRVKELVLSVAPKRSTVLLIGETGTGKEVVARAIHQSSTRKDYPLVAVNCGAIPGNLMEAEFFGHERGAFTDAHQLRMGRFEQANRGTLFLDEIGTMPIDLQGKLLRVLQERECQRIGGVQTIKLDVRFIAATNINMEEKVRDGAFREDLYYRLNVFPIFLPALRDRREDIPQLAAHLLDKIAAVEGIAPKRISQEALKVLMSYSWPGNIRQLENVLEMAIILSGERDYLLPGDLPPLNRNGASSDSGSQDHTPRVEVPPEGVDLNHLIAQYERAMIQEGLRLSHGRRTQAAMLLGLKRTTLLEKMKRYEQQAVGA